MHVVLLGAAETKFSEIEGTLPRRRYARLA
jgi:hypothetical protein